MKKFIQAAWVGQSLDKGKLARSLLQYRNTPSRRDGLSPAQKLFGHPIKDAAFMPKWQQSMEAQACKCNDQVELFYNRHAHFLPEIHTGSHVVVQNLVSRHWDIYRVVIEVNPHQRYYVRTSSKHILVRNRQLLRRRVPPSSTTGPSYASSCSTTPTPTPSPPTGLSNPNSHVAMPAPMVAPTAPRHSTHVCSKPHRLIEEITFK